MAKPGPPSSAVVEPAGRPPENYPELGLPAFLGFALSRVDASNFRFVQVGANDGSTNDLIFDLVREFDLEGLLIEPQPDVFAALVQNYGNSGRLRFANLALSDETGRRSLFQVAPEFHASYRQACGYNPTGIASFDRGHVKKHLERNFGRVMEQRGLTSDQCIVSTLVECMPLGEALESSGIRDVDLLMIDTEGYDAEVIRMIDFDTLRPAIIVYEHKHLGAEDRAACRDLLASRGYRQYSHRANTIAFLPGRP